MCDASQCFDAVVELGLHCVLVGTFQTEPEIDQNKTTTLKAVCVSPIMQKASKTQQSKKYSFESGVTSAG